VIGTYTLDTIGNGSILLFELSFVESLEIAAFGTDFLAFTFFYGEPRDYPNMSSVTSLENEISFSSDTGELSIASSLTILAAYPTRHF